MEKIDFKELEIKKQKEEKTGSFSENFKCKFDKKLYAFKLFNDSNYIYDKLEKIELISKINEKELLTPKILVTKDNNIIGYLTDYYNGYSASNYKNLYTYEMKKIKILNNMKNSINVMHQNGIIHGDLHSSNYLIKNTGAKIIDFDNCEYKSFKMNIDDTNDLSYDFITKYGVCKEVDYYLFNLVTFQMMNDTLLYCIPGEIKNKEYGSFENNEEAIQICNTFFLDDDVPNKKLLIDTLKK